MAESTTTVSTNKITKDSSVFTLDMIETLLNRVRAINSVCPRHKQKRVVIKDWIGNSYPVTEIKLDQDGNLILYGVTLPISKISGLSVGSL